MMMRIAGIASNGAIPVTAVSGKIFFWHSHHRSQDTGKEPEDGRDLQTFV